MAEQVRVFRRRHRLACEVAPALLALPIFIAWIAAVSITVSWCERRDIELLGAVSDQFGVAAASMLALLIGPGVAFTLAWVGPAIIMRHFVRRRLAFYESGPACVHCDYDLSAAAELEDGTRHCPECGRSVLPLRARFHLLRVVVPR